VYDHFAALTGVLQARFKASQLLQVPTDLGRVRELFAAEFLETHLPQQLRWGDGEIVDSEDASSGQQDIVIYRGNIPKLHMAGTTNLFLAESVVATVEVKSRLDRTTLIAVLDSVKRVKSLKRVEGIGFHVAGPELAHLKNTIKSYILAFDGLTVQSIAETLGEYFKGASASDIERCAPDVICVLGRGAVFKDDALLAPLCQGGFSMRERGDELAVLFAHLVMSSQLVLVEYFHMLDYLVHKRPDPRVATTGA
jgi:hypothetical protein